MLREVTDVEFKQLMCEQKVLDQKERIVEAIVSTSDLDDGGDIIEQGAFDKSIESNASRIKMLWQHKTDQPIGRPLEMRELENGGLYTRSYVSKIQKGQDYLTLAEEGIVTEFSIGFTIPEGKSAYDEDGIRRIKEINLMEYSPVTWGMNKNTQLIGIKSIEELRPKEIERVLREAGLTESQAKAIAAAGYRALREADPKALTEASEMLASWKRGRELAALRAAVESYKVLTEVN